jgi:hypothetical protein
MQALKAAPDALALALPGALGAAEEPVPGARAQLVSVKAAAQIRPAAIVRVFFT